MALDWVTGITAAVIGLALGLGLAGVTLYALRLKRRRWEESWRRYQELVAAHPNTPLDPALARRLAETLEYAELRQFLGGYFHQDWHFDFGSPEEVLDAYVEDASDDEVATLAWEIDQLLALGLSEGEMQEALGILHSYYVPLGDSSAWVRSVRERLSRRNAESDRN